MSYSFNRISSSLAAVLLAAACGPSSHEDPTLHITGTEEAPLMREVVGANGERALVPTCAPEKALICHIPPGNPAAAHAICVGKPAVSPHSRLHDDTEGDCAPADGGTPADGGIVEGPGSENGPGKGGGRPEGAGKPAEDGGAANPPTGEEGAPIPPPATDAGSIN
jgi:hypothetical protein